MRKCFVACGRCAIPKLLQIQTVVFTARLAGPPHVNHYKSTKSDFYSLPDPTHAHI